MNMIHMFLIFRIKECFYLFLYIGLEIVIFTTNKLWKLFQIIDNYVFRSGKD